MFPLMHATLAELIDLTSWPAEAWVPCDFDHAPRQGGVVPSWGGKKLSKTKSETGKMRKRQKDETWISETLSYLSWWNITCTATCYQKQFAKVCFHEKGSHPMEMPWSRHATSGPWSCHQHLGCTHVKYVMIVGLHMIVHQSVLHHIIIFPVLMLSYQTWKSEGAPVENQDHFSPLAYVCMNGERQCNIEM